MTQAFFQSSIPIDRDSFVDSAVPELKLRPDKPVKILDRSISVFCSDRW